jgi:hypothetical protein
MQAQGPVTTALSITASTLVTNGEAYVMCESGDTDIVFRSWRWYSNSHVPLMATPQNSFVSFNASVIHQATLESSETAHNLKWRHLTYSLCPS